MISKISLYQRIIHNISRSLDTTQPVRSTYASMDKHGQKPDMFHRCQSVEDKSPCTLAQRWKQVETRAAYPPVMLYPISLCPPSPSTNALPLPLPPLSLSFFSFSLSLFLSLFTLLKGNAINMLNPTHYKCYKY